MKEASGELSMTAVAVVAIAGVAAIFITLVLPNLKAGIKARTNCAQAFGCTGTDLSHQTCYYCTTDSCESTGKVFCDNSEAK